MIFGILNKLYTSKESKWILDVPEKDIKPYIIQRFLVMNDRVKNETRHLDKYIYHLKPKEYLSLAWSVIPKSEKSPYINYIKKEVVKDNLEFIMVKVRKFFKMSDNDWDINKDRIRIMIDNNKAEWFKFFGIRKYYWKKFGIDFNKIRG